MELRQLRYFLAIADNGSITSAAEALHMAQPPLSLQLKQLEDELGVLLVQRGSRHCRLTEAGELLRDRAEAIIALSSSTAKELKAFGQGLSGNLCLGVVSSSGLPDDHIRDFHDRFPELSFELREGNTYQVLDYLKKGVVEVGVVRTPFDAVDFECRPILVEPMVAAYTGDNPFGGKTPLSVTDLRDQPLVIYRRFEHIIVEVCEGAGFKPQITCLGDDARTALAWARAGYGIALTPRSALALDRPGRKGKDLMLDYSVLDCDRLCTALTAVVAKNHILSAPARRFFESFSPPAT